MKTISDISLRADVRRAIEEAARHLRDHWPVTEVVLFGSLARGDARPDSDIDLLVLTSRPTTCGEWGKMLNQLVPIELAHEVMFELLIQEREEWLHGVTQALPIRHIVDREGVQIPRMMATP